MSETGFETSNLESLKKLSPEIKDTGLMIGELPVYQVDPDFPFRVGFVLRGIYVDPEGLREIPKGKSGYSVGANPCISGLGISKEGGQVLLFHSLGEGLTLEQKMLIGRSDTGAVGGRQTLLKRYHNLFSRKNYLILESEDPKADFNILVVRVKDIEIPVGGKVLTLPEGVFYGYGRLGTRL